MGTGTWERKHKNGNMGTGKWEREHANGNMGTGTWEREREQLVLHKNTSIE